MKTMLIFLVSLALFVVTMAVVSVARLFRQWRGPKKWRKTVFGNVRE
jgi:hypothetical protein